MLNLTIASLHLKGNAMPILSKSQIGNLFLKNFDILRSQSTAISLSSKIQTVRVDISRFSKFLNSPIRLSDESRAKENIHNRLDFTFGKTGFLSVTSCMFSECETTSEGGAIYVFDETLTVTVHILRSSFFECFSSASHGGALYIWVQSVDVRETCFLKCHASDSHGQAAYIEVTDKKPLNFVTCDIKECPGEANIGLAAPLKVIQGNQNIQQCNFTRNTVDEIYSAFSTEASTSLILSFINFVQNTGCVLFSLDGARFNDDISIINVVRNIVPDSSYGLISLIDEAVTLEDVVFLYNTPIILHSPTDDSKVVFIHCDFDSPVDKVNFTANFDVTMKDCSYSPEKTYRLSFFDDRHCWMIDPPRLEVTNSVFWLLPVAFIYFAVVAYGKLSQFSLTKSNALLAGGDNVPSNTQ